MPGKRFLTVSLSLTLVFFCRAQTIFIASGSVWKYTTGTDLGSAWKNSSYNDSSWAQGPSQLGYGDGDEATVISNVPIRPTYYFRQKVNITNPNSYAGFTMQVKRDDGIVVYVNGSEIFRDNISADTSGYNSWAASTCSDDGAVWITAILSSAVFVN